MNISTKTIIIIILAAFAFKLILYNNYGCTGLISCNIQALKSY